MTDTNRVHLFVATPALNYQMDGRYVRSLMNLAALAHELGWGLAWWNEADSLIPRARNWYTHDFLKGPKRDVYEKHGPYTHLLSIDADIIFDPRVVAAMIATGHEVVCCAYPKKNINWTRVAQASKLYYKDPQSFASDYAINFLKMGDVKHENLCVPILDAATGFLMTTRAAMLRAVASYPELVYVDDAQGPRYGEAAVGIWDCYTEPSTLRPLSEDYAFSRRWQNIGGRVMLYLGPGCQLGHVGTHVYRGDIYQWAKPNVEDALESSLPEDVGTYGDVMLERYEWAAEVLKGAQRVADACCGPGYGMPILKRTCADVTGFDRDSTNIEIATDRAYGDVKQVPDVQAESFDGYDALCTLETMEHLPDPVEWLKNVSPTVTRLALSCPCIPTKHRNKYHLHDFSYAEVLRILQALGWTVKSHRHQDHGSVILVYAERPGAAAMQVAA